MEDGKPTSVTEESTHTEMGLWPKCCGKPDTGQFCLMFDVSAKGERVNGTWSMG